MPLERLPAAKELGETSLMFPVHPTISSGDMSLAVEKIAKILTMASSLKKSS